MGQIMIRGVDKESSIRGRNKTLRSPEVENENKRPVQLKR
jgi:hypothetical protein